MTVPSGKQHQEPIVVFSDRCQGEEDGNAPGTLVLEYPDSCDNDHLCGHVNKEEDWDRSNDKTVGTLT